MKGQGTQTRVHYKGVNSSEDFIVIAESPEIVQKWRGDKSIAMTEVVNSYQIFITGGHGNQGTLETPAKGTLENEFGTSNVDDVIKQILEKGNVLETLSHDKQGSKNESMGGRNNF